jgi:septum formation protein
MPPRDLVEANAVMKALDVAQTVSGDLVLAADTVVVLDGEVLGKPTDFDHARVMLSRLSGRIHEVLTGVCMLRGGTQARCSFVESTRVSFRQLDAEAMESYLREINPLDKAGAYAAQDDRGRLIEQIEGPLDNVIGLPVTRVTEAMLRHFTESPAG